MTSAICGGHDIEATSTQGSVPTEREECSRSTAGHRPRTSKYAWRPEYDAYLKDHYFGGLNRRFQVLNRMIRMTGLPRWYIKRHAARLGLTMHMDRRPWTRTELDRLENMVGQVSTATIAKRLGRPESSVVNKLKRLGTSRRVRDGYTMRELELCLGEDHHKITKWIQSGWLQDRLQGTRRRGRSRNDIHRIREDDVVEFIRNHPQQINLGKVDQTWFLDLLLLKGREVRQAKSPRKAVEPTDSPLRTGT